MVKGRGLQNSGSVQMITHLHPQERLRTIAAKPPFPI
jgi:hypothetical protein